MDLTHKNIVEAMGGPVPTSGYWQYQDAHFYMNTPRKCKGHQMLFQNKFFHGRHAEEKAVLAEEKAVLAEVTSAACGGFSRPRERALRKQKHSVP